jgi:hypothetical protein
MSKRKLYLLAAMMFGGATVFQSGCLNAFLQGFFNTGWPRGDRRINILIDVLNEELFG